MRIISPAAKGRRLYQGGSILGVSAIAMLAILGVVGLAVDISHMYLVAAELQNAADAAALAGASALNGGAGGIQTAIDRAITAMNKYEFNKTAVGLVEANVTFAAYLADFGTGAEKTTKATAQAAAASMKFVKVSVPAKTVSTVVAKAFMQVAGGTVPAFTVGPSAVAGQSVGINSVCNFVPFAIVQDGTASLTTTCANKTTFQQGCVYQSKLNSANGSTISGGDFILLNLASARAGTDLRSRMGIGVDLCLQTSANVAVEIGNGTKAGQVRQGLNTRFDDYSGSGMNATDFPPDTNVKAGINFTQYKSGSTSSSDFQAPTHSPALPDRRLLILPIIDASSFAASGGATVSLTNFGAFFLQTVGGGNSGVTIEYVNNNFNNITVGNGGYVLGGAHLTGLTVPVLYR